MGEPACVFLQSVAWTPSPSQSAPEASVAAVLADTTAVTAARWTPDQ